MSAPVKYSHVILGASLIFALLGLMWVAGNVGQLRRQDGQRYTVALDDGSGLPLGSSVRLAGVEVGTIESVEVVGGQAVFTLVLDPAVELHADAAAGPRSKSLLGQKYIELRAGSETAPRLAEGGAIANSWDAYDVDEALNALEPVFGADGSLVSIGEDARELLELVESGSETGTESEPGSEPAPATDSQAQVDELSAQITELREAAADARELSTTARDELPGLLADANTQLRGRELDRTLDRLDRLAARTAKDLPSLFATGERSLRELDARVDELDAFARGVTPGRVAELDEVLDELASASASARTMTSDLDGFGTDVGPLIDNLERLARRAAAIDELTVRKFLQEEGFRIHFGGGDRKQAEDRIEALDGE